MTRPRPFIDKYLGRWAPPARCEVKAVQSGDQCPEVAAYALDQDRGRVGFVCEECLPTWIALLTKKGRTVTVERIGAAQRADQADA